MYVTSALKSWLLVNLLTFLLITASCGNTTAHHPVFSKADPTAQIVPSPTLVSTPNPSPVSVVAKPTRLIIPTLNINAPVEEVGITANGELATPSQHPWDGVGWFSPGIRPGEMGSAVIDGHLDRPGGAAAIFWYLHEMNVGEKVMVVDTIGITRSFRVTRIAAYPPTQAPLQAIFGNAAGPFLNLITCAGTWIPDQHQTTLRIVVYTTMI